MLVADAELAQQLVRGPAGVLAPPADEQQRQLDVLDRGQRRQQVEELEHEADLAAAQARELGLAQLVDALAVEPDLAGRRAIEAGEEVEQRRLAAPARAHDRDELAALDREVDAAQASTFAPPVS